MFCHVMGEIWPLWFFFCFFIGRLKLTARGEFTKWAGLGVEKRMILKMELHLDI